MVKDHSDRQDNTYHGICYTSRGALAGTRNSPLFIQLLNNTLSILSLLYGTLLLYCLAAVAGLNPTYYVPAAFSQDSFKVLTFSVN